MKFYRNILTYEKFSRNSILISWPDKYFLDNTNFWKFWKEKSFLKGFEYIGEDSIFLNDSKFKKLYNWCNNNLKTFKFHGVILEDSFGNRMNAICIDIKNNDDILAFKMKWE